jgi:ferritin-like protein
MATANITIQVDADVAKVYAAATPEVRRKMQLLLSLRLQDLASSPPQSLLKLMDEIGAEAEARGMTPEVLESLLHDE